MLRECSFGKLEGVHYDNMSDEEKNAFSDPSYQFENGESWEDVQKRGYLFFKSLEQGNHIAFTHGGFIVSQLVEQGVTEFPNNGSVLGLSIAEGKIRDLDFQWDYPLITEDI